MSTRRATRMTNQPEESSIMNWILILLIPLFAVGGIFYLATQDDGLSMPPSLDFSGGARLEYQIDEKDAIRKGIETPNDLQAALERVQELFLFRLRNFDLSEIIVKPVGDDRLLIEIPGTQAIERVKVEIGNPAVLSFRLLVGNSVSADEFSQLSEGAQQKYFTFEGTDSYYEISEPIFDVAGIDYYQTRWLYSEPPIRKPYILLVLQPGVDQTFADMTTEYYDKQIAICLDNVIVSAPRVAAREIREPTITGDFTEAEARDLARILRSGPMPVSLDLVSETSTSPALGQDNLRRGLIGITVGFAFFILIFVLAYADHLAMLATAGICIVLEGMLIFICARMGWLTLNMIALAGLTVLLGMTVDNLILVFEEFRSRQLKEDIRPETLLKELRRAFKEEAGIIMIANIITVAALVPLLRLEGPVKDLVSVMVLGTGITLMITVWFARRLLTTREFVLPLDDASPSHRPLLPNRFDLFKLNRPFLMLYIVAIIASVVSLATQGLEFGLDFKGGTEISLFSSEGVGIENLRTIASDYFGERAEVKRLSGNLGSANEIEYIVWIPDTEQDEEPGQPLMNSTAEEFVNILQEELSDQIRLGSVNLLGATVIGLSLKTVLFSVGAGIFLIILIIGFKFGLGYSIPVLAATFFDGVIIIGAISLFRVPVSIPVIGTVLTILSYSTNDSIVLCGHIFREFKSGEIYDKLEKMRTFTPNELRHVQQDAGAFTSNYFSNILKDLSLRVVLTSLTTVVAAAALWITGQGILRDFGLIVTIGIVVGTFSSISLVAGRLKSIHARDIQNDATELLGDTELVPTDPDEDEDIDD